MNKNIFVIGTMLLLSGCSLTPKQASMMSKYELCETMLNSKWNREIAFEALESMEGGLDYCNKASDHILAGERRRSQSITALSNTLMRYSEIEHQKALQTQQRNKHVFCTTTSQGSFGTINCH